MIIFWSFSLRGIQCVESVPRTSLYIDWMGILPVHVFPQWPLCNLGLMFELEMRHDGLLRLLGDEWEALEFSIKLFLSLPNHGR